MRMRVTIPKAQELPHRKGCQGIPSNRAGRDTFFRLPTTTLRPPTSDTGLKNRFPPLSTPTQSDTEKNRVSMAKLQQ